MHSLLLDTYSLMYRAYYALPPSIADADGRPVNAVHGYLDMTARLLHAHRPERLVHVFDDAIRPEERVSAWPAYKASRPPDPEALPPQFALLERALGALAAERAAAPGWEADDAIAALCGSAETGDRLDIVTGDRDLLALVRDAAPRVRVLYTVRGVSELAVYDERAVEEKYGVPPARYADFAMLRGDPSDGLPGVPGVGEKTAAKLIRAYPSLDALLEDLGTQPARLAVRLTAARGYLDAMRRVVPARAGVRVEVKAGERDAALLEDLSERGGLGGPLRRLSEAMEQ